MEIHKIKILPNHFKAVKKNLKKSEIRKNDRNYKDGDIIFLQEFDDRKMFKCYTGSEIVVKITHILHGGKYGIEEGYCVISFRILREEEKLSLIKKD
jgi:hypothetical protein